MWKRVWAAADRSGWGSWSERTVWWNGKTGSQVHFRPSWFDEAVVVLGHCRSKSVRNVGEHLENAPSCTRTGLRCVICYTDWKTAPVKRFFSMLLMWNTLGTYHVLLATFLWLFFFFHLIRETIVRKKLLNPFQPSRMYSFIWDVIAGRTRGLSQA